MTFNAIKLVCNNCEVTSEFFLCDSDNNFPVYSTMEAVAKHEFNATADDELSFKRSQVLKVSKTFSSSASVFMANFVDIEHGR